MRVQGDRHLVDAVELADAHVDVLGSGGGQVLAHVVRADGHTARTVRPVYSTSSTITTVMALTSKSMCEACTTGASGRVPTSSR
jgi:hypothetical protein